MSAHPPTPDSPHSHSHSTSHGLSHAEEHFEQSQFLRDLVIGASDGLTVPFALAAGLSGAVSSPALVTTAGIAEVVAGSIAMGLGGYLAGRTEVEHYEGELKREYREIDEVPEHEKAEVREIFAEYGVPPSSLDAMVEALARDRDRWVQFMMRFELGLERPKKNQAARTALTVGLAYAFGGMIPLAPYFLFETTTAGLQASAAITALALFGFGSFKARLTGRPMLRGGLGVLLVGSLAAAAAYGVARWFTQG